MFPPFLLTIKQSSRNILIISCYQSILIHKYVKFMSKLTTTIKQTLISDSNNSDYIVHYYFYGVVKSDLSLVQA